MSFDYSAPAELFLFKPAKGSRTKYRRFATAAEALRYAVEDLRTPKAFGAHMEVGDERFDSIEIQRLYEAEDYPLRRTEWRLPYGPSLLSGFRRARLSANAAE
jgi:hypothetical protein